MASAVRSSPARVALAKVSSWAGYGDGDGEWVVGGMRWPGTWADVLGVLAWCRVLTWWWWGVAEHLSTPDDELVGVCDTWR